MNNRYKTQAYTLIEILVTLSVMAILMAIALVTFMQYLDSARLNEAAQTVVETLRRAGSAALSRSEGYTVAASGSALTWQKATDSVAQTQALPNGATVTNLTPAGPIQFSGRGLPTVQYTLTITTQGGRTKKVVLLPTGKVVLP